jgi:hypothetical protein
LATWVVAEADAAEMATASMSPAASKVAVRRRGIKFVSPEGRGSLVAAGL